MLLWDSSAAFYRWRHRHRDVSGPEGAECGSGPRIRYLQALEAAFYLVGLVSLLSLLTLGQQFTTAGTADRTLLQAIGNLLVSVRDHAAPGGGVRLLRGCIYVLLPVVPVTAHSPLAIGLRIVAIILMMVGLRVGLIQR